MLFFKQNIDLTKNKSSLEIEKLDFLSTRVFIEKKLKNSSKVSITNDNLTIDTDKIYQSENRLFFNQAILLNNVQSFKIKKNKNILINICTKIICQEIIIKY